MACTNIKIIGLGENAFVDEETELRAKTVPSPEDVTWHLDLGVNPKISGAHGEILRTSWDSVGVKQLEVRCSGLQVFFEKHVLKRQPTSGPPLIITGSEVTPEVRAFNPHATDPAVRNKGRINLSVHVVNIPEGGVRVRWTVAEEPTTERSGKVRLLAVKEETDDQPDDKPAKTVEGRRVEVIGFNPGFTAVDVEVLGSGDVVLASQKFQLMVPQFVLVDVPEGISGFTEESLKTFGLVNLRDDILQNAKTASDDLLKEANVRMIWLAPPFNQQPPAHLTDDLMTVALISGDAPPDLVDFIGRTRDGNGGEEFIGPEHFDERVFVFPTVMIAPHLTGADAIPEVVELNRRVLNGVASPLAVDVVSHTIGKVLAHETLHTLLGRFFPHPSGRQTHVIGTLRDLMNLGPVATFFETTGVQILDKATFPAALSFSNLGVSLIIRPAGGGSLDAIHERWPVPPDFE